MTDDKTTPPGWAEAILRCLVRPCDRETIPGDFLEEFRESRYPARGALAANAWYIAQVFSMLWRLIRPPVLVLVAVQVAFAVLLRRDPPEANTPHFMLMTFWWYGSPAQAPGISLFDAMVYSWAAYRATRHSALVKSGVLAGAMTGFIASTALFVAIAFGSPQLLLAPFAQPFIFVILAVLLSMAVAYGIFFGLLGGMIGFCVAAVLPRERPS